MISRSPGYRRKIPSEDPLISDRKLQASPPRKHSDLVRRKGGIISLPRKLKLPSPATENSDLLRPTKFLLNVTMENSLGPVQVLMSPEDTVADLVKAALVIYEREKRRPFLKDTDPRHHELHYSPFSLESLKANEKLMNLGSRNFFLYRRPCTGSCSQEANMKMDSAFLLTMFGHLLL